MIASHHHRVHHHVPGGHDDPAQRGDHQPALPTLRVRRDPLGNDEGRVHHHEPRGRDQVRDEAEELGPQFVGVVIRPVNQSGCHAEAFIRQADDKRQREQRQRGAPAPALAGMQDGESKPEQGRQRGEKRIHQREQVEAQNDHVVNGQERERYQKNPHQFSGHGRPPSQFYIFPQFGVYSPKILSQEALP